jgi:transcription elongation factor Elf1
MSKYRKIECPVCGKILLLKSEVLQRNKEKKIVITCKSCKQKFSLTIT